MRQSATVHVNLDLGDDAQARRRWRAAQLLAPIAIATFAHSPYCEGQRSGFQSWRGRVWTETDPTRCGFPRLFLEDVAGDPVEQYLDFALNGRLLMIEVDGTWRAQTTPLTFERWMTDGAGGTYPTLLDWERHLTTLFPEVRPRGFFELRSADCQSRAFWSVPLTWWTALLCDDPTLDSVLARLAGSGGDLPARYLEGARAGVGSDRIRADAQAVYRLAMEALPRFSDGFFSGEMVQAFDAFGERFTLAGRSPAEEILERAPASGLDRATLGAIDKEWRALVAGNESPIPSPRRDLS
jgi:glutamate--cysteine ligase